MKVQNLRFCGTPLYRYIEFAGIHSDLFFASEGTASPKLAVRSDDRTSQTGGLSGCRSCSPHSLLRSEKIWFIQPLIQSNSKRDMPQPLRLILTPDAQTHFIFREHKNRAPKSPVFAVKFSYATNQNPTGRLYPVQILLSNQTSH